MNVREIIIEKLHAIGADGLCCPKINCWCSVDEFPECVEDFDTVRTCVPAKSTDAIYEEMK